MNNPIDEQQAAYYLALAERASSEIVGSQGAAWIDQLEGEYVQLQVALKWFVDNREPEQGLRLVIALYRFWSTRRQYIGDGREWFAQLLALPADTADRATRAKALGFAGLLAFRHGDMAASRALAEESVAIWRDLGDNDGLATALADLARLALREGDHGQVRQRAEEGLAILRKLGDRPGTISPLHLLAASARMQGDYDRAAQLYAETSALYQELGNENGVAMEHFNMGYVTLRQGDARVAAQHFKESIRYYRERGDESMIAVSLAGMGGVALAQGEPQRATRLLAVSDTLNKSLGVVLDPDDKLEFDRDVAGSRASLEESAFGAEWAEGQAMSLQQAIAFAVQTPAA